MSIKCVYNKMYNSVRPKNKKKIVAGERAKKVRVGR